MDWNWFFAALAQSTAAIVGLFGAFIVTKILSNQATYKRNLQRGRELVREAYRLQDLASNRRFDWYNREKRVQAFEKLDNLMRDGDGSRRPGEYYEELAFSPYDADEEAILEEIGWRLQREPPRHDVLMDITGPAELQLSQRVRQEGDEIAVLLTDVQHHRREVAFFLREIKSDPQSSGLISFSIAAVLVLFYVGVIYPLGFLPLAPTQTISVNLSAVPDAVLSFRGLLLGVVALVFSAMMGHFLRINRRLRYSEGVRDRLNELMDLGFYSSYFAPLEQETDSGEPPSDDES